MLLGLTVLRLFIIQKMARFAQGEDLRAHSDDEEAAARKLEESRKRRAAMMTQADKRPPLKQKTTQMCHVNSRIYIKEYDMMIHMHAGNLYNSIYI